MKIRWTENSLRLRITPTELAELQSARRVATRLEYPGGSWHVAIQPEGEITSLCGSGPTVCLFLGRRDINALSTPEAEGVYFTEGGFRYFIEKDFPCIHPRPAEAMETPTECFAAPLGFEDRKA